MKKILFATTALVMTAGAAAADVSVSGFGRFGIADSGVDGTGTYIEQRFQFDFVGEVETDTGLTVGGKMRARSQESKTFSDTDGDTFTTEDATFSGAQMYVEGGGLKLEVGNIDYALDNMPGLGQTIGLANWQSALKNAPGYSSRGSSSTGAALIYSMDGFTGHLSYDMTAETTDVYVSYDYAGYTFALGYMDTYDVLATEWAASVSGSLSMFDFNIGYTDNQDGGGVWTAGASYDVNSAMDLGLYVMYYDKLAAGSTDEVAANGTSETGVGVDAGYDLGNGVGLHGGVYNINDTTAYDFGISFSF